ncbi:hypothetical protein [Microbacterium dauci]|uniref:Uncharacterized protein n=1 Tax=Microbacterium dauci TaxID=3048008 RepID=A0ABT6ZBS1_9MICO|nr:hypothetical protein [Microbacterium sp. LX3-4]MDJ1113604.1 hypothetical protein [Microbacterium sp. LX3-4]
MRYLLIAPYSGVQVNRRPHVEWLDMPPRTSSVWVEEHVTVVFREVAVVHGYRVLFLVVDVADTRRDLDHLEMFLDEVARVAGEAHSSEAPLRWVARLQLSMDHSESDVWPAADRLQVSIGDGASLAIGWGGGRLDGWDALAPSIHIEILAGLAEAQALWCELADLMETARGDFDDLYTSTSAAGAHKRLESLVRVSAEFQRHTLSWGQVSNGTRIRPRAVARATLAAWDYPATRAQAESDISAAMAHAQVVDQLAVSRYQKAVEGVLLALTFVSALGLVIGLVDLSFTVVGQGSAGSQGRGLLEVIRFSDIDGVLIGSGVVLAVSLVSLLGAGALSRRFK